MVERGAQVVNCVSDDCAQGWRRFLVDHRDPFTVPGIRVFLFDDRVGVALEESIQRYWEVVDVLVGPFDL